MTKRGKTSTIRLKPKNKTTDRRKKNIDGLNLTYHEAQNGMLYPDLKLPEQTHYPIGKYGDLRLRYLKEHRKGTYTTLLTQCRLNSHLHEIEQTAKTMLSRLMQQMAESRGVNEQMKAENPMLWVQEMNSIKASAEETVLNDLIYT